MSIERQPDRLDQRSRRFIMKFPIRESEPKQR
jgi:hypothetical protein